MEAHEMRYKISSWVRQARHRAKKHGCISDLELPAVMAVLDEYNGKCVYCDGKAVMVDHAFPLSGKSPNVIANCLPICKECRNKKRNDDLFTFQQAGHLSRPKLLELIKSMLSRAGADHLRGHIGDITGIGCQE